MLKWDTAIGVKLKITCLLSRSLSGRLIAFHRGTHCYIANSEMDLGFRRFQSPFHRGSTEWIARAIANLLRSTEDTRLSTIVQCSDGIVLPESS